MTALAKRAVACKGFRWMPGMAYVAESVNGHSPARGRVQQPLPEHPSPCNDQWVPRPDLDDPATLGCFEHGLLPACGYNDAHLDAGADRAGNVLFYVVYRPDPLSFPGKWLSAVEDGCATKAEALVAALEAAP